MTIIAKDGWHTFALDGTNLNIISVYPNVVQKYAMLYRTNVSSGEHVCIIEIWEYGFEKKATTDVECTVYYLA